MRPAAMFVLTSALSIVPRAVSAQAVVTRPEAGTPSSYRATTIAWQPIPGATSYHLEIDDDPNFGSPEVDVTVPGTSYALSGERLKLHGQLTWAAYVRINGVRWDARTFSASYFTGRKGPALGVDSRNRVYLASDGASSRAQLTTSSDWSSVTPISPTDTPSFARPIALAVDESDVAHVFWLERPSYPRWVPPPTEAVVPYYTNSSMGWNPVRIPGTVDGCHETSMVAGGGHVDMFLACSGIDRFTTTDGITFTKTTIPHASWPDSISTARDRVGNMYVLSDQLKTPPADYSSVLQMSADGWIPSEIAPGRYPGLTVTPNSEQHVLRSVFNNQDKNHSVFYSNSLRSFETWTELPLRLPCSNRFPRLVVDETRYQLHAALPSACFGTDRGLLNLAFCSAAYTGLAIDTGASWTCSPVGDGGASQPDLALAPDGTLHVAWTGSYGVGYANSLGSFLAANFPPQVRFGASSSGPSTATVPTTIFDPDGDDMSGEIHVGRHEHMALPLPPGRTIPFFYGLYTLQNTDNVYISGNELQFRPVGGTFWDLNLYRHQVPTLPAMVEVRHTNGETVGAFIIMAWDDVGAAVGQGNFVPSMTFSYTGALPDKVDISALSEGDAMVKVTASDGSRLGFGLYGFTKTAGQVWLELRSGGADASASQSLSISSR